MSPKPLWTLALATAMISAASAQQFVYPAKGQSPQQQKSDEAACYTWAVQQSGFDPAKPPPAQAAAKPPTTATGTTPHAATRRMDWFMDIGASRGGASFVSAVYGAGWRRSMHPSGPRRARAVGDRLRSHGRGATGQPARRAMAWERSSGTSCSLMSRWKAAGSPATKARHSGSPST